MVLAIAIFVAVMGVVLFLADRVSGHGAASRVADHRLPAAGRRCMLAVGLLYPAIRRSSSRSRTRDGNAFVGLDNYKTIFTSSDQLIVLRNTAIWVHRHAVRRHARSACVYAVLIDKARSRRSPRR